MKLLLLLKDVSFFFLTKSIDILTIKTGVLEKEISPMNAYR